MFRHNIKQNFSRHDNLCRYSTYRNIGDKFADKNKTGKYLVNDKCFCHLTHNNTSTHGKFFPTYSLMKMTNKSCVVNTLLFSSKYVILGALLIFPFIGYYLHKHNFLYTQLL